jgi:ketosteroid isomerase-like protein
VLRLAIPWLLVASATTVAACDRKPRSADSVDQGAAQREVAAAMQRYQVAARAVNPDSIAGFYTTNAMLFEPGINPIRTRDSIRAFLASFPGVRVDVATATPDTIEIFGNKAFLWGSYFERLAFPGQPVSEQHGKFVTEWEKQEDGSWLIERFFRIPIPSPPPRK